MRRLTKKMPKMVAIILAFALMAPIVTRPIDAEAARARWINYSGSWYYELSNGNLARGWQYIGGNWYYFHPTSQKMLTGMQRISNTYYYFEASGAMVTGWVRYSGYWYYFQPGTGAITDGWKLINGNWYYFDYAMSTGMETIGSKKYYFGNDGAMKTGWQQYAGEWYYFQPGNGAALKNQWIGNYYVQSDGTMATNQWIGNYYVGPGGEWIPGFNSNFSGWYACGGKWYYYTRGSVTYGHKTINSIPYYFDEYTGAMYANQMLWDYDDIDGTPRDRYYDSSGAAAVGWRQYYGGWYYFAPYDMNGYNKYEAVYGWLELGENTYYIAYEGTIEYAGAMLTGWKGIDGYWYYFNPSTGAMVKNQWIGNYYVKDDGRMATNEWIGRYFVGADGAWISEYQKQNDWVNSNGDWYYQLPDGELAIGWQTIDGEIYYFESNGVMQTGWKIIDNHKYYFNENGVMQTGWLLWSNFRFYLLEDGKMAIGWQQIEGSWYYFYKEDDIDCRCPGEMAIDTWVDGYFVNIDGKRV